MVLRSTSDLCRLLRSGPILYLDIMSDDSAPPHDRAGRVAAGVAGLVLLGVFVTAGVISTATSSTSAAPVDSAPLAETRPAATPEQAYELSLPVLGRLDRQRVR